jgi:Cu/Ag efflux pump CusA
MTTIAMIAGMLPLALVLDPGAQAARSLGTVVIGGLASSLLLTLLLVPVVYVALAADNMPRDDDGGPRRTDCPPAAEPSLFDATAR